MVPPQEIQHDAAAVEQVRPYRSHKIPACERCRARKLRCTVDMKNKPCLLCRLHSAECIRPSDQQTNLAASPTSANHQTKHSGSSQSTVRRRSRSPSPKRRRTTLPGSTTGSSTANSGSSPQPEYRRRSEAGRRRRCSEEPSHDRASEPFAIVGPESAEDLHVIERYISSSVRSPATGMGNGCPPRPGDASRKKLFNLVSKDPSNPVVSLSVPRYRAGYVVARVPGKTQLEILEQILGPLKSEVIEVYFRKNHPAFPILDESAFLAAKERDSMHMIAPSLLCYVYATSLIYWDSSPILRKHPRPDIAYALNQCVSALQEDFHAASLSTVYAALLDLCGRPTTAVTYNAMLNGRVVAMAHLLGLNRDPEGWDLTDSDQKLRIRLWWGVLIHDRWSSLAYGVPPSIAQSQHDVPLPTMATLATPCIEPSLERDRAAEGFIALCSLTEILGDILPLLHDLRRKNSGNTSRIRRNLESDLEEWESNLPDFLRNGGKHGNGEPPVSGASSLWLGFLAVKMSLCRINLREASRATNSIDTEERNHHLSKLRKAAEATVDFVCSLSEENLLSEFWSAYTAHHLSSVTFLLLRCAIESTDPAASVSCRSSVERLRARLSEAREESGWDMGDICLAQSEESVTKVVNASHNSGTSAATADASGGMTGGSVLGIDLPPTTVLPMPMAGVGMPGDAEGGFMFPVDGPGTAAGFFQPQNMPTYNAIDPSGYPWADLWDMFNVDSMGM